ncbi:VCBS repeat-containing protein, partial [Candidatus Woesearchaeota archaeon]|nr:VCBS repeat-containing protein [Candidatus Woesearchaeota archaeon]
MVRVVLGGNRTIPASRVTTYNSRVAIALMSPQDGNSYYDGNCTIAVNSTLNSSRKHEELMGVYSYIPQLFTFELANGNYLLNAFCTVYNKKSEILLYPLTVNAKEVISPFSESLGWEQNLIPANFQTVVYGDIDNNGYLDIISNDCKQQRRDGFSYPYDPGCTSSDDPYSGIVRVYTNNGATFKENLEFEKNLNKTNLTLALGDIDNDGDLDLILDYDVPQIYINTGTTFIWGPSWENWTASTGIDGQPIFADFNNDGRLDLIFIISSENQYDLVVDKSFVLLNNGTAFNIDAAFSSQLPQTPYRGTASGVFDINNDNYIDLVAVGGSY